MIMNHEYEKDARSHGEREWVSEWVRGVFRERTEFIFPYSHAPHIRISRISAYIHANTRENVRREKIMEKSWSNKEKRSHIFHHFRLLLR